MTTDLLGADGYILDVTLQPDGKIVAAGVAFNDSRDFALVRFNPDGGVDATFGSGGKVVVDLSDQHDDAHAVEVQRDGRILVAGTRDAVGFADFALSRFRADGSRDPSFGPGGTVTAEFFDSGEWASTMALQPDGKILVAGSAHNPTTSAQGVAIARFNPDGSLDATFGTGGKAVTELLFGGSEVPSLALQPDGKIIVSASGATRGPDDPVGLVRFRPNGTLDPSFGNGGLAVTNFPGDTVNQEPRALGIQPDGKIVVAGRTNGPVGGGFFGRFDFAVVRFDADGTLDPSFGTGGKVTTDFAGDMDIPYDLAIKANGKILVTGWCVGVPGGGIDFGLMQYNPDGSPDAHFGTDGKILTDFFGGSDQPFAVAVQPDGRIVVGGLAFVGNRQQFALARYEPSVPTIAEARLEGKALSVFGENIDSGATILLDDRPQKTRNDPEDPSGHLVAKKAGKRIRNEPVRLRIRNVDGALSEELVFSRSGG